MLRRDVLKGAAASAAWFAVSGCASRRVRAGMPTAVPGCALPRINVSADREIRTTVGLRPFRPSGFVVRAERIADKLLVHNYGHGGGGITLSWGTSKLAVDAAQLSTSTDVAVLGSGAVGLATARLLQEHGHSVTIYTRDLPPNTTSNLAGGQWFPFMVFDPPRATPEFMNQFVAAAEFAYRRYQIMVGARYGVRWMRNYFVRKDPFYEQGLIGNESRLRPFMPEFRDLNEREHPFGGYKFVRQFDSMIVEVPVYLSAMLADFRQAGGTVAVREFHDAAELGKLRESVIFNCTGLGSSALFNDPELVPVKGQLTFLLPQPEIDYAVLPDDLYMFPRSDGIILGGTHERGNWSLDVNAEAKASILARHKQFFDSYRGC